MASRPQKSSSPNTQAPGTLKWVAFVLIGLICIAAGLLLILQTASKPSEPSAGAPSLGGDFQLDSGKGPVALNDFRDQVVVMMFGFTSCPDVCPTGMATVAAAIKQLEESQQQQVQPLFISVDPERDTAAKLDEYAHYFHPRFIGLTGSTEAIDEVVRSYGAFYQKVPMPDSELGYTVDHSTRVYLINRQGQLAKLMFHNSPPAEIGKEIAALLRL